MASRYDASVCVASNACKSSTTPGALDRFYARHTGTCAGNDAASAGCGSQRSTADQAQTKMQLQDRPRASSSLSDLKHLRDGIQAQRTGSDCTPASRQVLFLSHITEVATCTRYPQHRLGCFPVAASCAPCGHSATGPGLSVSFDACSPRLVSFANGGGSA
jgi:hypothetical protein